MAYKVTMIDLDKATKCLCCQQPIPDDEHFFSTCDSNVEFSKLGASGFALLFDLNFYVSIQFFVLSLIYFVPMVYFWNDALVTID